jgi:hypothetical protein
LSKKSIYYLPGANGRIDTGLGEALTSRGFGVSGRATVGEFRQLYFQEQIDLIATDLQTNFWTDESMVICNSYGAYLFLNVQGQLPPYIGRVLILSPILGVFENVLKGQTFFPPRADRLINQVRNGGYPAPLCAEIHVGSEDWQSPPAIVKEFGALVGCPVYIAPGKGHMLGKDYVGAVLDHWLTS